jgi:hypothetical protein
LEFAMSFSTAALNQALDGITIDRVMLHSGDPGATGSANQVSALQAATFNAASGAARALNADVAFTGLTANVGVTWFSVWLNAGTVFKGRFQITSGDVAANAAGEYTLKAPTTQLTAS